MHQPGLARSYADLAGNQWARSFRTGDWWRHLLLITVCGLMFFPFIITIFISFKTIPQFNHDPFGLSFPLHPENYVDAWSVVNRYLFNTIVVAALTIVGTVVVATLAAYVFARRRFPGREPLYVLIIILLMIPGILQFVPQFLLVKDLGLLETWWALILPYIAGGQPFAIFILRAFFEGIPEELFEAARMDGASEFTIYLRIVIPLSQSIIGVVSIVQLLNVWNDFIWPMVTLTQRDLQTLAIGLYNFRSEFYSVWGPLMAGYVIAAIPLIIVFALMSRLFVEGLSSGAIKM